MASLKILAYSLISLAQTFLILWFNWLFGMNDNYNLFGVFLVYFFLGLIYIPALKLNLKTYFIVTFLPLVIVSCLPTDGDFSFTLLRIVHALIAASWAVIFLKASWGKKKIKIIVPIGFLATLGVLFFFYLVIFPKMDILKAKQSLHLNKARIWEHNTELIDKNGKKLVFEPGQIFVLNFTFISCLPCRAKSSSYSALAKHFKNDKKVKFYTIHEVEDYGAFKDYYSKVSNAYHDKYGVLAKRLNCDAYPIEFIIDSKGEIRDCFKGFNDRMADEYLRDRISVINKLKKEL